MKSTLWSKVRRGVWVRFGRHSQMGADRVPMDVGAAGFEVFGIADEVVGEASLPDRSPKVQTVGKTALDQVHDFRDRLVARCEEQVRVVGHDDEGVQFIVASGTVELKGFE